MNNPTHIKATTIADLISVPRIMLGFDPAESVVVLGINGTRMEFCARMDVSAVEVECDSLAAQINDAARNSKIVEVFVLGFSDDAEGVAAAMAPFIDAMDALVVECLAVTSSHWWNVIGDGLVGDSTPHNAATTSPSVQAVVAGVNVREDRTAAVAAVQGPQRSDDNYSDLMEHSIRAAALVSGMTSQDQAEAAVELAASETELTTAQSTQLAALMNTEEGAGAVLNTLTRATAAIQRPRLTEARRVTPATHAGGVLALLGMTCWLDGEGAQAVECIVQLDAFDPDNQIGAILRALHRNAIPPSIWDQQN